MHRNDMEPSKIRKVLSLAILFSQFLSSVQVPFNFGSGNPIQPLPLPQEFETTTIFNKYGSPKEEHNNSSKHDSTNVSKKIIFQTQEDNSNGTRQRRTLTPVDLTKEFIFDDIEEIANASYTMEDIEKMKEEINKIFEVNTTTPNVSNKINFDMSDNMDKGNLENGSSNQTFFQFFQDKIHEGISLVQNVVTKPIKIIKNVLGSNEQPPQELANRISTSTSNKSPTDDPIAKIGIVKIESQPLQPSINQIIFQDDEINRIPASNQVKRGTNKTDDENEDIIFSGECEEQISPSDTSTSHSLACKDEEVTNQSRCEPLFSKGPCEVGKYLLQNETTGNIECTTHPCQEFPQQVFYNGTCVLLSYFNGCPTGMHLFLERSGNAYCDCKPKHIYSTEHDKCFEAYTQGPCRRSKYFVLKENEIGQLRPACVKNPCKRNNFVCVGAGCPNNKENCVPLYSICENGNGILMVNDTSLEPTCHSSIDDTKILGIVAPLRCSKGTKRDVTGVCRKTFKIKFS